MSVQEGLISDESIKESALVAESVPGVRERTVAGWDRGAFE